MFYSFRKTDFGLALTICLIIGIIFGVIHHPIAWDEAVTRISALEPRVEKTEKDIVELRTINSTQMSMIIRELDGIHKELKKDK